MNFYEWLFNNYFITKQEYSSYDVEKQIVFYSLYMKG